MLLCNLKATLDRRAAAGAARHGTYKAYFLGLHTCNLKATLIMRSGAGAAGHGTYKACFLRNFKEFLRILRNFALIRRACVCHSAGFAGFAGFGDF